MSDLFGAPSPPPPPPAKRGGRPTGQAGQAGEEPAKQAKQVEPAAPPIAQAPPKGHLVTLHNGRQVDSWSAEWRVECLANTLLQLEWQDRDEWLKQFGRQHGDAVEQELRGLIRAISAARRASTAKG